MGHAADLARTGTLVTQRRCNDRGLDLMCEKRIETISELRALADRPAVPGGDGA